MKPDQLQDLLDIKQGLGIPDPRFGLKECELCDNNEFRAGVSCEVPSKPTASTPATAFDSNVESIVKAVTDQIMANLKG